MSKHQITIKPISEVAKFQRNLIPLNIPDSYKLKPTIGNIADEDSIRSGIVAFRDFALNLCDKLISDGHLFAKPPKNPVSMTDYPFVHKLANLLVDIGYYSNISENGDSLLITDIPLCNASIDDNGKKKSPKISAPVLIECLRFLTLCGFVFPCVNMEAKNLYVSESNPLAVTYPENPVLLIGLKALSIADMELRTGRRYWNDNNILRCNYRLLKAEETNIQDELSDFLQPLPVSVQEFAINLHKRYTDMGLTCTLNILGDFSFSYADIGKSRTALSPRDKYQKRIWAFTYSIRHGYSLFVRAKKTDKYPETIKEFSPYLQKKILTGYGCFRKLGRKHCTGDCQGIRLPLNESTASISSEIETWLDCEMPSSFIV